MRSLSAKPVVRMFHPLADIFEPSWRADVPAGLPQFRSPHKQRLAAAIRAKKTRR
jgi:hypothetical protein